jgi:hypothetical protein
MEEWRKIAFEKLPELGNEPTPMETLIDVSLSLSRLLHEALNLENTSLVRRIIDFALWQAELADGEEQFLHNTIDIFVICFQSPRLRQGILRLLTNAEFEKLKHFFIASPNSHGLSLDEMSEEYRNVRSKVKGYNKFQDRRR